jgi:hypothetical protein
MALEPQSEIRNVTGITDTQRTAIEHFMQGAIYTWVKNKEGAFAVRDLVGGVNTDWIGTPLHVLYEKHIQMNKSPEDAFKSAAKDLGWIVKAMIDRDRRRFSFLKSGLVNSYSWED